MQRGQLLKQLSGLAGRLGWDHYFGTPGQQADMAPGNPRRRATLAGLVALGIFAGGFYFYHAMLGFTAAINANATAIMGPYPNTVIITAVLPAYAGLFLLGLDYFRLKTGLLRLASPPGIAAGLVLALLLWALSGLPGALIKQRVNAYAAAHGYAKCSSLFDPAHLHVYALQSYVAAYGCPTAGPPQ